MPLVTFFSVLELPEKNRKDTPPLVRRGLTLAWFLNFIQYTKYVCTVVQNTGVLIVQWFKSENSLGSVDS